MNSYYNKNYTEKEIEEVLEKIKYCVHSGNFTISLNEKRKENIDFINEYNIRSSKQKDILLNIKVEDFCHSLQNIKPGYEHEVLYVFVPQVQLYDPDGMERKVDIYTKFNIIEKPDGNKTVVISFDRKNRPVEYIFK